MSVPAASKPTPGANGDSVVVEAPGRLHLGFLDPSGTLGRRFGSLGVTLGDFVTLVELAHAEKDAFVAGADAEPAEIERLARHVAAMRRLAGTDRPLRATLHRSLPVHAGFGSGTQLALAVGHAFAVLHGLALSTESIALALARGSRSGVGIRAFAQGGFLVDAGQGAGGTLPPVVSRFEFPDEWRVVLVFDDRLHGLHGGEESVEIGKLGVFPRSCAAELCHQLLLAVLPGLAERDFAAFAAGLMQIQDANGAHFAPAQGGTAYVSPAVADVLSVLRARFAAAVGQSSWGPTGFGFLPSQRTADDAVKVLRGSGSVPPHVRLVVARGRNRGARVFRRAGARLVPAAPGDEPEARRS